MKKNPEDPKIKTLPEVKVTATRIKKKPVVEPEVSLYPKGSVKKRTVDSLLKARPELTKPVGKPTQKPGHQARYGTTQSDIIKSALKKKKKHEQ